MAEQQPRAFVCPNDTGSGPIHRVKWNSGNPWCLSCDVAAVVFRGFKKERD